MFSPYKDKQWSEYKTQRLQQLHRELSQIKTPALMIYSSKDQTISPAAVESTFPRFGSMKKEQVDAKSFEIVKK